MIFQSFFYFFENCTATLMCHLRGTWSSNHFDHWSSLLVTDCTFCIVRWKGFLTPLVFLFSSGWEDVDLKLIFVFALSLSRLVLYTYTISCLMMYSYVALWLRGGGVALCSTPPTFLPPTPRCATGRFCSTETRKIQRCLFLKEKRGVSSCSISFPCIYVFLSRGSLILMLMKNMLWNEHICRD